ncbi:ATP-binding protein [Actinoplanes sp. NBRC 103695]|uniref:NACHT domain-containing protein n=1 Tax=Actinoplanes sp. NBRC 103695 TaxID=3032202 RepID=UPI0024A14155|nr:ATP-binding protein [Actinoplanes sp. NBRC 103695]GLY99851.1 hypothetical protein Acsp02_71040 [Actinoplanes sp. NBRC 103695]
MERTPWQSLRFDCEPTPGWPTVRNLPDPIPYEGPHSPRLPGKLKKARDAAVGGSLRLPDLDFSQIRSLGPQGQRAGFEQFVCELAIADEPDLGARFVSLHGEGGDGGVECFWTRPDGLEVCWQAKYWTDQASVDKAQLDKSVDMALLVHPQMTRYVIAIPVDPTGPTTRAGQSLLEKLQDWKQSWERKAKVLSHPVEFVLEWRTQLIARLQKVDVSGVRTRYWFDVELLPDHWWRRRLDEALQGARPRYMPELTVAVPAATHIAALCGDPSWAIGIDTQIADLQGHVSTLDRAFQGAVPAAGQRVRASASTLIDLLGKLRDRPHASRHQQVEQAATDLLHVASGSERNEVAILDQRFEDEWDTPRWRQWHANYQAAFPAATVDALRTLIAYARQVLAEQAGPMGKLLGARAALMTGAAGTGKTFVTCDMVNDRLAERRPSVFLHAREFTDADILTQLREKLHLPSDFTGEEAIELLDQAGRTAGTPVLLVVDAINETRPRRIWHDQMDRVIATVSRCENLRVLFTVRSHYQEEVIPDGTDLVSFEHRGFEGVEFEAIDEYADFYGLEIPAAPPVHGELDNPLYLRLFCEALRDAGQLSLSQARMGLGELSDHLLTRKNVTISRSLGAPARDRIVQDGMAVLARRLGAETNGSLPRSEARKLLGAVWSQHTVDSSLLEALLSEGLLAEYSRPNQQSQRIDVIEMAFERLGHHLVISEQLSHLSTLDELRQAVTTGSLRQLLRLDEHPDQGLLEALSVVVADRFAVELTVLADTLAASESLTAATLAGLPWRDPTSITADTRMVVVSALENPKLTDAALDILLRHAALPHHPLNADFLHETLRTLPLGRRDAFLAPWLHHSQENRGSLKRLISWALSKDLRAVDADTCRLWIMALAWCTSATDRRVRDGATLAASRLLATRPDQAPHLVAAFADVDDDWIAERVLIIAYAALLEAGEVSDWAQTAAAVQEAVFAGTPPTNALIRDSGRAVIEAAVQRGALDEGRLLDVRPPYESPWPIEWPSDTDFHYLDAKGFAQINHSCTEGDFHTYVIEWIFDDFEDIDPIDVGRRLVLDTAAIGYDPSLHGAFDQFVTGRTEPDPDAPAGLERLGKKYQWIALARLVGVVQDHVRSRDERERPDGGPRGPQSVRLRRLDPTVLDTGWRAPEPRSWVPDYNWDAASQVADSDWVFNETIPSLDVDNAVIDGRPHLILAGQYRWKPDEQNSTAGRQIWLDLASVLVPTTNLPSLFEALETGQHDFHDLSHWPQLTSGYVGEYPFGIHYDFERYPYEHADDRAPWPAALTLIGEFEDQRTSYHLFAPSPTLFGAKSGKLRWDGSGSWRAADRTLIAQTRHFSGMRNELTIDSEWLTEWLSRNELALVWLEHAGQSTSSGSTSMGQLRRTRVMYKTAPGTLERRVLGLEKIYPPPQRHP